MPLGKIKYVPDTGILVVIFITFYIFIYAHAKLRYYNQLKIILLLCINKYYNLLLQYK